MSAARPTLVERLQAQVTRLEREAQHLRTVDRQMAGQLRATVEAHDRLRRENGVLAETLADLRRQLAARGTEVEQLRGELAAERTARPATSGSSTSTETAKPEAPAPTRWNRLEID